MAKAKSNKTKEIGEDNGVDISEENGPQQRSSDMDAVEMRANPDQAEIAHNIPEQILEDGVIPIPKPQQQQPGYIKAQIRNMPQSIAFQGYYDASAVQDFYRLSPPPTFMDGFQMSPYNQATTQATTITRSGSETLTQMYRSFNDKYLRAPHRKSQTHVTIAYYIYGCQLQMQNIAMSARGMAGVTAERRVAGNYARGAVDRCMNINGRLLNIPTHP